MITFRPKLTGLLCACAFIGLSPSLNALTLNERKGIEASIAKNYPTRIAVKDDRILNVFGSSGEYILETDEAQGQIFIKPNKGTKSVYLTFTTEKGHTQDLHLTPKDKSPEPLILEEEKEGMRKKQKISNHAPLLRHEVEDLLKACQENRIPMNYRETPLELNTMNQGGSPYLLVREVQNETFRGLTFEISNKESIPLILADPGVNLKGMADSLKVPPQDIVAITQSKSVLNPHEKGHLYVIARK